MSRIFLTNIDLQNNQILNLIAEKLAARPASGLVSGRIVFNTTSGLLEYWTGTAWISLNNNAGDADLLDGQHGTYYLSRSNHSGTQLAATISNFDTQVRTSRLDQMAVPTAALSLNSQKITSLATPTVATDAVTKAYADALVGAAGYSASVGNGTLTTITVTHNLNSRDILVAVWQVATPYAKVECDVAADTVNSIQLSFSVAPTSNQYRVCVTKA